MISKVFAKMGFGSAKVDTQLDSSFVEQGGTVSGNVVIKGGNVDQDISKVTLSVMTRAKHENDEGYYYADHCIGGVDIPYDCTVQAGQQISIPFSFNLPSETPITTINQGSNESAVWIDTNLDIDFGVDSEDRDFLNIKPHHAVQKVIDVITESGMRVVKTDVESGYLNTHQFSSTSGIYQEIELKPSGMFSRFEEVELSFIVDRDQIHLLVELDRRFGGDGYKGYTFPADITKEYANSLVSDIFS
ncbi:MULTISPECIES: sporulation protein [Vibrio]|uniref:SpoOM-related protein n=2 Tax=Vibrio TaxID=662 RepID=A0AAN1PW40_VIBVL|nr:MULTISPECIES: sporulation protein [Vibrio]TVN08019.1 sporulation protein [Vibrio cholerae]AXX63217.1 putative SpoOM-related protein [Vibrio vulnificus]EGR2221574.1 sporulation control protein Spo0M [Vibrio parahaemolyticus]EGR2854812.1 sporulation control protein Spo0M [Vibrio parahaemolyticus]EGR2988277.1 sporulation control protein Spo0M [Vibrio parahaemolyticus]